MSFPDTSKLVEAPSDAVDFAASLGYAVYYAEDTANVAKADSLITQLLEQHLITQDQQKQLFAIIKNPYNGSNADSDGVGSTALTKLIENVVNKLPKKPDLSPSALPSS